MGKAIKWFLVGVITLALLVLVWGTLFEPFLIDVENETAVVPNLPAAWQGSRVAVVGDFQLGMWGDNEAAVSKAVDRLIELRPEVVLILGDFIYHAPSTSQNQVKRTVDLLTPLVNASIPVYAVLGNHDYQVNDVGESPNLELAQRLENELEAIGVQVLHNEVVELQKQAPNEPPLYLVGIDAYQPRLDDPVGVFGSLSPQSPRLVMMHNPGSFAEVPAHAAPVALAGHTHGGQIRIPFTPEWSYLTYRSSEPVHVDGWIKDYGQPGNHLYVNRGIGFSLIPVRINCMPEVSLFTLQTSPDA